MKTLILCGLALAGSTTVTLAEMGKRPAKFMVEIVTLDDVAARVDGDLSVEASGSRTKVTTADDSEVLVDAAPGEVVARVCVADGRHVLKLTEGDVTLCKALPRP